MSDPYKTFTFPTTIIFGRGAIRRLPACLDELDAKKPLLITDRGLEQTGVLGKVREVLEGAGVSYAFSAEISPNPLADEVERAAEVFRENGCDSVIGLGGGSPLDAAKAVPVLAAHGGSLSSYDASTGGNQAITPPLPPMIAVPTTAGTGSEVGRCAVITAVKQARKFMVCSPHMMPARAILDPELTAGLPPLLTAATGMDAFTHNIEALAVDDYHPMCDAIALKGIEMVARYLPRAVENPNDIEARANMLMAASMGAVAFQKDLGAAHSLAHPLSARCHVHHGLANAICLPHVMRFNKEAAAEKYAEVARLLGVDTTGLTAMEATDKAIEAVINLNKDIGIPKTLNEVGVKEEDLVPLAKEAILDGCHATNPRPCTEEDLLELYKQAF